MQYRLSTIFLVFFVTAASLALFGPLGDLDVVLCVAALLFNKAKNTLDGAIRISYAVFIGIICPGFLLSEISFTPAREAARCVQCSNNLSNIGQALISYEDVHNHFPTVNSCDKDGKPLRSWLVEILPQMDRADLYDQLHKDEPWNSPHNAKVLSQFNLRELTCPSAHRAENDLSSHYVAIIGPGTIWRSDGPVSLKDLPIDPSITVAAVECVASDKHWAEPYALTAEEALERMKTGQGVRICSPHPSRVYVLFADGHTECLQCDMPISFWRKLLMGKLKCTDELNNWNDDPSDPPPTNMCVVNPPPQPGEWPFLLSIVVWLVSVAMLFYRAWDSRKLPVVGRSGGGDGGVRGEILY